MAEDYYGNIPFDQRFMPTDEFNALRDLITYRSSGERHPGIYDWRRPELGPPQTLPEVHGPQVPPTLGADRSQLHRQQGYSPDVQEFPSVSGSIPKLQSDHIADLMRVFGHQSQPTPPTAPVARDYSMAAYPQEIDPSVSIDVDNATPKFFAPNAGVDTDAVMDSAEDQRVASEMTVENERVAAALRSLKETGLPPTPGPAAHTPASPSAMAVAAKPNMDIGPDGKPLPAHGQHHAGGEVAPGDYSLHTPVAAEAASPGDDFMKQFEAKKDDLRMQKFYQGLGEGFGKMGDIRTGEMIRLGIDGQGEYVAGDTRRRVAELEQETSDDNDPTSAISSEWQKMVKEALGVTTTASAAQLMRTFPDLVKLQQGRERNAAALMASGSTSGGKMPSSGVKKLADMDLAVQELEKIEQMAADPEVAATIGPVMGRLTNAIEWAGYTSPAVSTFRQMLNDVRNKYIQAITGAQMSHQEATRIIGALPKETARLDTFLARLKTSKDLIKSQISTMERRHREAGYNMQPNEPMVTITKEMFDTGVPGAGDTSFGQSGDTREVRTPDGRYFDVTPEQIEQLEAAGEEFEYTDG